MLFHLKKSEKTSKYLYPHNYENNYVKQKTMNKALSFLNLLIIKWNKL